MYHRVAVATLDCIVCASRPQCRGQGVVGSPSEGHALATRGHPADSRDNYNVEEMDQGAVTLVVESPKPLGKCSKTK